VKIGSSQDLRAPCLRKSGDVRFDIISQSYELYASNNLIPVNKIIHQSGTEKN